MTQAAIKLWLIQVVLLAPAVGAQASAAAPPSAAQSASCGYFSPNPADDAGPPVLFYADLSADEESAVTNSPGNGHVELTLDRKSLRLSWKLTYKSLTSEVLGIAMYGPQTPGGEAGIVFDMAQSHHGIQVEGSTILKDADVTYLIQDRYYVNITTKSYPGGEIRGPVRKRPPKC